MPLLQEHRIRVFYDMKSGSVISILPGVCVCVCVCGAGGGGGRGGGGVASTGNLRF